MKFILVFFTFAVASSTANLFGPFWNGLRTTFALDGVTEFIPLLPLIRPATGYSPIPRTKSEALTSGWEPVSATPTCDNGGLFQGFRYIQRVNGSLDVSVSVLFDKNDIVAGIQMNVLVSVVKANPSNTYKFDEISMFLKNTINSLEVYTLTAYFVDPATICSVGRTSNDLRSEGTGTGLYFQNGPTPDAANLITAPMDRATALATGWNDNNCFPGMGVHNWYKTEDYDATNCDYLRPVFLLYTKLGSRLLGFGFQHVGVSLAPRFEQPPSSVVKIIMGPTAPQCLIDKSGGIGVTTMHVFMINNPLSQTCLI